MKHLLDPQTLHVLQHILWLMHHHHGHRAHLELMQLVWALRHGYPS